jgi:hypothetical protein
MIRQKKKQGIGPAFKFVGPVISDFSFYSEWRD